MKGLNLKDMTTVELVDRFASICVQQDQVLFENRIAEFNRLYDQMAEIRDELNSPRRPKERTSCAL